MEPETVLLSVAAQIYPCRTHCDGYAPALLILRSSERNLVISSEHNCRMLLSRCVTLSINSLHSCDSLLRGKFVVL